MSIKKTPICPFCKTEMKRMRLHPLEGEGHIATRLIRDEAKDCYNIKESFRFSIYNCEGCGFTAFWRGEP